MILSGEIDMENNVPYQKRPELLAAPFTPMNFDGSLKLGAIEALAARLLGTGVKGAFVGGTAGESMSLTVPERIDLAARWKQVAGNNFRLIIHIGHACLDDAKVLAQHARQIKADGFSAMSPFFFRPSSVSELVAYCAEIASAAPDLPFFYCHFWKMIIKEWLEDIY
jgi:N-acetylneuraminate lyase